MYEQVFHRIINASQNNSLTFFVGAGVSALSGAPKWSDLIDDMCREIGRTPKGTYTSDEYLCIPQMYYYSIDKNDEEYYSFIINSFEKSKLHPNTIHKMLMDLNPCSFITTNFDELLEEAAIQSAQGFKSIACDREISSINGDRYILKLHGDLKHKNIILKEEDYLNYSERFKLTETVLKSIFSMNTVVFIGYGLNDYNIKLVLNWAKTLLNDQFNEPIFIHTGSEELSREELLYQESKGVTVVECIKCKPDINYDTKYLERYKSVLDAINACSSYTIEGKTDAEVFDALYELLRPLDKLNALRTRDVYKKLREHVYIGEDGVISALPGKDNLLKHYSQICKLSEADRAALEPSTHEKYKIISSVLSKAGITYIREKHSQSKIEGVYTFGDIYCIGFDYCGMNEFCKSKRTEYDAYRQAYYLAKLMRYEEAYLLFLDVANEAFKKKDYLLYYLAQINCNNLHTTIKNINRYYRCYDMNTIESTALSKSQVEHFFERLPVEFRNAYSSLQDLNSVSFLYEYSYAAFVDGEKLQNAIESNSLEMGLTSSDKAICRINDYIHFLLGNGLYLDEFSEFKFTVSKLMSLLVYKYSDQGKMKISNEFMPDISRRKIGFDELDFYCFIEYFENKSISKLFDKYDIKTIEFQNMDAICAAIKNLLVYYDRILSKSESFIEVVSYQAKIKNCLTLLRYMDIPQDIVDYVCQFIFKYEFRDILINDKIIFLDRQLYCRKKYSAFTAKIIEDKLIYYIDSHIKAIETGTQFDILSTNTNINYYSLVDYISPDENFHSRRLSVRVSKIIKLGRSALFNHVINHYSHYLSAYQRANIVRCVKKDLEEDFDFDLFALLINCNARFNSVIISSLCDFLRIKLEENEKSESKNGAIKVLRDDKFSELNQVGYWCFLGALKKEPFSEFVGKCDEFDFYYLYEHFDFTKFNVSWLIFLKTPAIELISKNHDVKNRIRERVSKALREDNLSAKDELKLSKILYKYFC